MRDAWQIRTNVVQCAVEVAREDGWTRLAAEVVVDGPLVWAKSTAMFSARMPNSFPLRRSSYR